MGADAVIAYLRAQVPDTGDSPRAAKEGKVRNASLQARTRDPPIPRHRSRLPAGIALSFRDFRNSPFQQYAGTAGSYAPGEVSRPVVFPKGEYGAAAVPPPSAKLQEVVS